MTPAVLAAILSHADAGETVAAISTHLSLSPGSVYAVLRDHRPNRKRSPRTRTSAVPMQIHGLAAAGIKAARVAELLGVSNAYVYRILGE